jgi:hypothetical protein
MRFMNNTVLRLFPPLVLESPILYESRVDIHGTGSMDKSCEAGLPCTMVGCQKKKKEKGGYAIRTFHEARHARYIRSGEQ